jgi:subtilisin family serine protease/N-acetylneuraminic acid mutarotase
MIMPGPRHPSGLFAVAVMLLSALPSPTRAQTPQAQRRLDPILRASLVRHTLGPVRIPGRADISALDRAMGIEPAPSGADEAWIRVLVKGSGVEDAVRALGGSVGAVLGPVATAHLPLAALYSLAEAPGIEFIEASTLNHPALDEAIIGAHATDLYGPSYNLSGTGVLVGIYDTGIDYTHGDFIAGGGTSRILYLWDQTYDSDTYGIIGSVAYGAEWTQSEINNEIDGSPVGYVTQTDLNGHGTHVAGIAAGNGLAASKYQGLAPQADLVIIKGGDSGFPSADVIDGVAYFFARADNLARPGVINLSLGGHSGPHDGTSNYEVAIDNAVGTGKVVVVSAGNEANDSLHDRRQLLSVGDQDSFQVTLMSYSPASLSGDDYVDFNIWYEGSSSVDITFVAPDGTRFGPFVSGTLDGGDSAYGYFYVDNAWSVGIDPRNGDKNIFAEIYDNTAGWEPMAGNWWLVLELTSGSATAVDTWIFDWSIPSYVTAATPEYSISHPGTAIKALTAGAWVSKSTWLSTDANTYHYQPLPTVGDIADFSSWGPTRDDRLKPDIVAPGQGIMSAMSSQMTPPDVAWIDPSNMHRVSQGTSQAAPVVTGTVALMLEADPTLTADQIKQFIQDTALNDGYTGSIPGGSNEWGYGKLDAQAAVDAVLGATGTSLAITLYQPTGVQQGSVTVSYHIEDPDLSFVDLTVEYSEDYGENWQTATTTGLTTGITMAEYDSAFVWVSDGDFYDSDHSEIWLRVTPSDGTPGTADITRFPLDNYPPHEITAEGEPGTDTVNFWFDQPVDVTSATLTDNYTLSGGLTFASFHKIPEWSSVPSAPYAAWGMGAAEVDGNPCLVGGNDGSNYRVDLNRFDFGTDSWTDLAAMSTARAHPAVGVIDGLLYVAGGEIGTNSYTGVLEVYDPCGDTWSTLTSMLTPRAMAAYGVIRGRLYVTGGRGSAGALTSGEYYDPATDSWTPIAPHPEDKYGAAFGVVNEQLYVIGGAGSENWLSVHAYDPRLDSWSPALTPLSDHRRLAASAVIQGRIHLAGGVDGTGTSHADLLVYTPATDSWYPQDPLAATRYHAVGLAYDGSMYVVGGRETGVVTDRIDQWNPASYFIATLTAGQTLPSTEVTIQAYNIQDLQGNEASFLGTTFTPYTNQRPTVIVRQPTGTQSGDVGLHYEICDPDGDSVGLLVEYRRAGDPTWSAAAVFPTPNDTTEIAPTDYTGSIGWDTGVTDLPGELARQVQLRITPHDYDGWGTPDTTLVDIDNLAPESVLGHGAPYNDNAVWFWFDEVLDATSVTNTGAISFDSGLDVSSVTVYNDWRMSESPLPSARMQGAAAVIGTTVYAVGGYDGSNVLDLVEAYDTVLKTWTPCAPMQQARQGHFAGVVDGKLYVAGGLDPGGRSGLHDRRHNPRQVVRGHRIGRPQPAHGASVHLRSRPGRVDGRSRLRNGCG